MSVTPTISPEWPTLPPAVIENNSIEKPEPKLPDGGINYTW